MLDARETLLREREALLDVREIIRLRGTAWSRVNLELITRPAAPIPAPAGTAGPGTELSGSRPLHSRSTGTARHVRRPASVTVARPARPHGTAEAVSGWEE